MHKHELEMLRDALLLLLADLNANPNKYEKRYNDNWVHIDEVIRFIERKIKEEK